MGGAGSQSSTIWPGPRPRPTSVPNGILIHPAVWTQKTWAENWGCAPLGGAGSSSNIMWPRPRPTSITSGILIHPSVWPQYTNVTDRQTGQTTVPEHRVEPFYKRSPKTAEPMRTDHHTIKAVWQHRDLGFVQWCKVGDFLHHFCVLYFPRAACITFRVASVG